MLTSFSGSFQFGRRRSTIASIVTQDLAIWIDANDAASYSGTGTAITDLSGNGRTQNLQNAAQYTVLDGVKCFDCSITTYYITAASAVPVLPTTGFTYIAWARMNSSTSTWRTLFRSNPSDHALLIEIGTNRLGMYDNQTSAFYPSGYNDVSSLADVWVQWAVTGDSSGQTFYINGQQVGTTVKTAAGNSHWYTGLEDQSFGYIANMFLYTSKLTQEQIQQNYYALRDRFAEPEIVADNLVLWYDPNDPASYPGTGTAISNLASAALPGTMSNITYTDPYFAYNGTSSQIAIADAAALEPGSGDWTMEAWVYLSSATGSKVVLGKFDPGGASQDVSYSIRIQGAGIYAQIGNGSTVVDTALYTLPLNTWTHVTYVWKNVATNSLEAYVNGANAGSVSHSFASVLNTSSNLYIGSYNGGEYSQYMNGRIGITRLYNAALTAAEVQQNFDATRSKYSI
jgi:hypothetical protein